MKRIAIANRKGGCGKTTAAMNVGFGLADKGKKVLLIDLDSQCNLTRSVDIPEPEITLYELLKQSNIDATNCILPIAETDNLSIIPASKDLNVLEVELSAKIGGEITLRKRLNNLEDFDYVIMDCPPSLSMMTVNALVACQYVIVITRPAFLDLGGMADIIETIDTVKEIYNPNIEIGGILISFYDKRRNLDNQVVNLIKSEYEKELFDTKIRPNISITEAPGFQQSIFDYSPKSNGAEDYGNLIEEIQGRME